MTRDSSPSSADRTASAPDNLGRTRCTPQGLSSAQVAERIARGAVNHLPPRTGKSVADIIRTNLFTRINAILVVLLALVITTGSWINCAFGLLIIVNSAIGIIQELRAKRTLESLSVIGQERPRVIRDGIERELPQDELVIDDLIAVGSGRQIVVDGEVLTSDYLAVNESLLTGESDLVYKQPGDQLLSGSFVATGSGYYRVTAVGADSYAARLTTQASEYALRKSHLQASIDHILKIITWILIPVAISIVIAQILSGSSYKQTILAITGALVPMVPEGLVLITSTAFALGVIRLGQRKCLVQELPAIEGLARVDVVCADKTGTLTEGRLALSGVTPCGHLSESDVREVLAQIVAADLDRNSTTEAIFDALNTPADEWPVASRVPFSSAYKWSSISFENHGTWLLGAPDVLTAPHSHAYVRAAKLGRTGARVLLLASASQPAWSTAITNGPHLIHPNDLHRVVTPVALVSFEQRVRPDAADTISYFMSQGVAVKVISGDNPESVAGVTAALGITDRRAVDARDLSEQSSADIAQNLERHAVFGRVRPEQKLQMIRSLQESGHTVAMTGDGVNDVLALKEADIGVAMGTGSSAARAVAKLVLLDNRFATLPHVVAEGRRVIGNIERVAHLFLTKTTYSAMLAVLVICAGVPFPFQPIHVTITGWFTIGIPAFILALPPNNSRAKAGFTKRVLSFAIPSGVIVGISSFFTYLLTSGWHVPDEHTQQSTAALAALIIPSVWVLACVARPWRTWKIALFLAPVVAYSVMFFLPFTQELFLLDSSNIRMMGTALIVGAIAASCVELSWHLVGKRMSVHLSAGA